jgi:tetraacyldisaccharide 4'-kinase
MRAPAFWFEDRSALAQLLRPAAFCYGAVASRRMARPGVRISAPVVTVGNFVAGGAGKTPAALAIARLLQGQDRAPAFVSRGYGGSLSPHGALRVTQQSADEVGDEPLLLAKVAPTFVGADRVAAATLAIESEKPSVIVLDDGLQSRRIEPDLAIAIVDGATGIGNGLCLPAGPLRAPLAAQLPHVQAVVIVGDGARGEAVAATARERGVAVFYAKLGPDDSARALAGQKVVAFAGIGRPEKFFATLAGSGAEIVARKPFGDHHRYGAGDLDALRRLAAAQDARLVTTEKDFARLPTDMQAVTTTVAVRMVFEAEFEKFLLDRLQAVARKV